MKTALLSLLSVCEGARIINSRIFDDAPKAVNAVVAGPPVLAKAGVVTSCSGAGALAQNFVPTTNTSDTVAPGDYVALIFDYDLLAPVTGGSVYFNTTVNGFLPYNAVDDLCTDQANSDDPCPLGVGHHHNIGVTQVPASGVSSLKLLIQWTDSSGNEILCASQSWTISAVGEPVPEPHVAEAAEAAAPFEPRIHDVAA